LIIHHLRILRKKGVFLLMLNHKDHFHGSDLEKIEEIYHINKEDIISFSANINPLGIPGDLKKYLSQHLDAISSYPDREYKNLRSCIAQYCGTNPQNVIVGNGSTELISLMIENVHPKRAMILGPSYSEYEREISLCGGHTLYYPLKEEQDFLLDVQDLCVHLTSRLDMLVICNPNNPTSTSITYPQMRRILDACLQHGIFAMVDETYVEFTDPASDVSSIKLTNYYTNLVVLRGTSKFFAAPGLRLGYAVTGNQDMIRKVSTRQNPWTISSLAEIAGCLMFRDKDYQKQTLDLITEERDRVYRELCSWKSVKAFKPSANFILVKILREDVDADELFDHCIRKNMMIRNCSTFPFLNNKFFRFCFMKKEDNDRLLAALREVLED